MFNPQPNVYLKKSEEMRLGLHHSRSISLLLLRSFFRSCATIVLVSTGTHLMYISTIYKEQMQTKYSDVINVYSIIAGYCCSLDPPLYCPGLYRPCFAFLLWLLIIVDSQVVPCNAVYLFSLQLESVRSDTHKQSWRSFVCFVTNYFIALISVGVRKECSVMTRSKWRTSAGTFVFDL